MISGTDEVDMPRRWTESGRIRRGVFLALPENFVVFGLALRAKEVPGAPQVSTGKPKVAIDRIAGLEW